MSAQSGRLTVDLDAVQENYRILRDKTGGACAVACAVKADAYGLGTAQVAPALYAAGCRRFCVATPEEGAALRGMIPDARIAVLGGFMAGSGGDFQRCGLVPVLNSMEDISSCSAFAREAGARLPAILHFDTGMNRLGIGAADARKLGEDSGVLDALDVTGVMSHFACADEADHPMNERQYEAFISIAKAFPDVPRSLCNSSGIFRSACYHLEEVRPGMALYGLNPTPDSSNPMRPVVALDAPVLQIRTAEKGETCGYNATYEFEESAVLAVVSAGYADGMLRSLSNAGALYWKDYRLPIRGRVSMDLVICEITAVPENERPGQGDRLEIIGPHQSADDLAKAAGTMGYEILTSLGPRYSRTYRAQLAGRRTAA